MGRKRLNRQVIGIRLLPDSYIPQSSNSNELNNGKIIGTVYASIEGKTCACFRQLINFYTKAPKDFCFLNSVGWPLSIALEDKILISDCLISCIVTIQIKHKELTKVGIKLFNGKILGFIFLNFATDFETAHVRKLIISQLHDQFEINETCEFYENNSWRVREDQEKELSVWDLVVDNYIIIEKKLSKRNIDIGHDKPDKKLKLVKKPSLDVMNRVEEFCSYSILISYVHQEATTYARDLKNELLNLGFKKIFLDIDDISAGQDWQDVISLAVNNCSIFIPLVTQRYGETRWTNREAKLADDREKRIIPVSFLEKWPPDQLAIQFVTLQYIPWKTSDEMNGGSFSGHSEYVWNRKSVRRVANEIKSLCSEPSTPDSASLLDGNLRSSTGFSLKLGEKQRSKLGGEKIFVVISAHVKQKEFVEMVTKTLESDNYKVWTSMNMCDCDENLFSPLEDTQPLYHSLPESNSIEEKGDIEHPSSNVKRLKRDFKAKIKEAKLVVLIFSEEYLNSRICRQQLFYCEQRKKVIVIKHGDFQIDSLILNLYPEHEMITKENWGCLRYKIKEKLSFDTQDSYRNNIMLSVAALRNVIDTNVTAYIIGGTDRISSAAHSFCLQLGTELAKVKHLNLATEGFMGVGELVGKNFCEERVLKNKGQPPSVYHILPTKDDSDYSHKAPQNADGTFEKLPYGNTLYYGMSVVNRDDIVAAAFKLCILIEGGERSACLAEKFLWNDCTVIPVLYSNTAVKYKQCLSESIIKVPTGVNESDWQNLSMQSCSVEERAKSVKRIVYSVLNFKKLNNSSEIALDND